MSRRVNWAQTLDRTGLDRTGLDKKRQDKTGQADDQEVREGQCRSQMQDMQRCAVSGRGMGIVGTRANEGRRDSGSSEGGVVGRFGGSAALESFPKLFCQLQLWKSYAKLERDGGCRRSGGRVGMELASVVSGQSSLVQVSQCRTGLAGEVLVLLVHAARLG